MKKRYLISILLAIMFIVALIALPTAAQDNRPEDHQRAKPQGNQTLEVPAYLTPEWGGTWQFGPDTGFQFTRFDGEFFPDDGLVYFLGGRLADNSTDGSVWSFDPVAGTYTDMGVDLVTPISNYTINLLQDANGWGMYIFCGRNAAGGQTLGVQVYYPDTNTPVQLDPADNYPGTGTCSSGINVIYENKIYIAGGFDGTLNYAETWIFDPMAPSGSRWTQIVSANLSTARAYIMGVEVNDLIYAIGGNYWNGSTLIDVQTVEVLNPNDAVPVWNDAAVADLPEACSSSRAWGFDTGSFYQDPDGTPLAGKIVSGCGNWADENTHVYVYDTGLDFWEAFPSIQTDRRDEAAALLPQPGQTLENGIPGLWIWGGRKDSDANILVSSEYYDLGYDTGECSVLLVDDDVDFDSTHGGGRPYYTSTLDLLGYPYDLWDNVSMGPPTAADMSPYDAVVWFTGYDWQDPISPTVEVPELSAYMDAGGSVFISSQEQNYAYPGDPFLSDYLWVDTIVDDVTLRGIQGNATDPLYSGLGPSVMDRPDAWDAYWPTDQYEGPYDDEVTVKPGGYEPMVYTATLTSNSTRFEGLNYKSVYLGYPMEWLVNLDDRAEVLGTALDWFCQPAAGAMNLIPPGQVGEGIAGATVPYTLTIVNDLGWDETFSMTYTANWPISGPLTVGPVADGATESFTVTVDIPTNLNCFESDLAEALAVAQSTPVISDTAYIETTVSPAGTGKITGQILDANTGEGVTDAFVYIELGDEDATTWTNTAGEYLLDNVYACGWTAQVEAMGYYGKSGLPVEVSVGLTTTLDVILDAASPVLSANDINIELPPDTSDTYTLSVSNNGTGDLNFHVSEIPADSIYPVSIQSEAMPKGIDPQVYADIEASVDGSTTFIVYMAEQADLSKAFEIADWNARGQYVLDTLRATAERTQAGVKAYLSEANIPYESRYIINAIVVHGNNMILSDLANRPEVGFIGPNTAIKAPEPVETSPSLDSMLGIEWNISKVKADLVWDEFEVTGNGMVIANIDTGVQWDHPALIQQYRGWDGSMADHNHNWWDPYNQSPLVPQDTYFHGTHTMGTMVGSDDPTQPISATNGIGMAPGANWFACDGFDDETQVGYNAELLECAEFILAPWDLTGANPMPSLRAHVVNNSWGGGQAQWWYNQAVYAWRAAGIFGVFSAGNDGPSCSTAGDPGDMSNMLAVGATNDVDQIASFSSRGPGLVTGILKPNVSAPGVNVTSAYNNGDYGLASGTSMAAPHVAGEAALLWSAEPALIGNVDLTYWIIEHSAVPLTTTEGCGGDPHDAVPNNTFGWGRIDAYEAVSLTLNSNWDIPWLEVSPESGDVLPGESTNVTLTFDATGLEVDSCVTGDLKLDFNDPYVTEAIVPVEMCVVEPTYPIYLPITFKQ